MIHTWTLIIKFWAKKKSLKIRDFFDLWRSGPELKPMPTDLKGGVSEPEMEYLSKIVKAFNEKFGTAFTNEDKVRKMTQELMLDVMEDKEAIENINASISKQDLQNARITFTDVLKEKMVNHIESNFEVFKEYNDNPEFRAFLVGQMFNLMLKDFTSANFMK
jgi:type I restriction enzyme R subunit